MLMVKFTCLGVDLECMMGATLLSLLEKPLSGVAREVPEPEGRFIPALQARITTCKVVR